MFRSHKTILPVFLFVILSLSSAIVAQADPITVTLPNFNGPFAVGGTFPRPTLTVATFNFTLPAGFEIGSATLSGTFGNSVGGTTAPVTLFLDSLQVTQCATGAPCTGAFGTSGPTPFCLQFLRRQLFVVDRRDCGVELFATRAGHGATRQPNPDHYADTGADEPAIAG